MLTLHRDQDHSEHDSIAQHRMPCLLLLCQAIMLLAGACSPVISIMLCAGACSLVSAGACMLLMLLNPACATHVKQ